MLTRISIKTRTKSYTLDHTENMEYVSWFVTAQTAARVKVAIRGLKEEVILTNRPQPSVCIGHGAAEKLVNTKLTVDIEIRCGYELKHLERMDNIPNDKGEIVATVFMYSVEDWADNDYNDVTIHIATWKKENK